jgi:hypothetical protein
MKLQKHGVETSAWGKDQAKSVQELFWEIQKGECILETRKGELKRILTVLRIELWAETCHGKRVLMQCDEQLQDGRVRKGLNRRVAKKMSTGETKEEALSRALASELDLEPPWVAKHVTVEKQDESFAERASKGFPGIETVYNFKTFYMQVNDPTHEECRRIGLPFGDDFETKEFSLLGQNRQHYWSWASYQPVDSEKNKDETVTKTMSQRSSRRKHSGEKKKVDKFHSNHSTRSDHSARSVWSEDLTPTARGMKTWLKPFTAWK